MKTVFVKMENCIGCRHCEIACVVEHTFGKNLLSLVNEESQSQPRIKVGMGIDFMTFPNRCRHCDPAPCKEICPTGAIFREEETGSVLVKESKCISCGMCAMVCSFSTINYYQNLPTGKPSAYKCDDCINRQKAGAEPACVEACKTGALYWGEINDIINNQKNNIVMKITKDQKGIRDEHIPANVAMYRNILENIAALGPIPSSK